MSTRATLAKSKQQSDTSPSAQNELPEPDPSDFTYFLDESITITSLIHAMRSANLDVKVLGEEFHALLTRFLIILLRPKFERLLPSCFSRGEGAEGG